MKALIPTPVVELVEVESVSEISAKEWITNQTQEHLIAVQVTGNINSVL